MVSPVSFVSVLAAQLTVAREVQRLTQRELAAMVGVRQARLCEWENGVTPTLGHLVLWADALGYEVALLRREA